MGPLPPLEKTRKEEKKSSPTSATSAMLNMHQSTHQEVSNLLDEILQLLVAALKVLLLFLGFLQRLLHLLLHVQRQRGDVLELCSGNRTDRNQTSNASLAFLEAEGTFVVTPCRSSSAAVRWSVRFWALSRAAADKLTVPVHPSPPHWLSMQTPLVLPGAPQTWREHIHY